VAHDDDKYPSVRYSLARTVVNITGTVSWAPPLPGDPKPQRRVVTVISLSTAADTRPRYQRTARFDRHHGKMHFDLTLTPDGRLAGANYGDTGVGTKVIGTVISVAAFTGSLLAPIAAAAAGVAPAPAAALMEEEESSKTSPAPPDYWTTLSSRAAALDRAVTTWREWLVGLKTADIPPDKPPDPKDKPTGLDFVSSLLTSLRAEQKLVADLQTAWLADRYPPATLTYTIPVDELPPLATADIDKIDAKWLDLDRDHGVTEDLRAAAEKLQTIVLRLEDGHSPAYPEDFPTDRIYYRLPQPVCLAVFRQSADPGAPDPAADATQSWRLVQLVPTWMVGTESEEADLPIDECLFSTDGGTISFGPIGTLAELSNTREGAIGSIADAIANALPSAAAAPSAAAGPAAGAASTGSSASGASTSPATASDPMLAALEAEVTFRELQVRLATANATISKNQ
jgi:hypothetical protein